MPALVDPVVVNEFGIRLLRSTPRGLIELVRKGGHRDRDGDVFRGKEGKLAVSTREESFNHVNVTGIRKIASALLMKRWLRC